MLKSSRFLIGLVAGAAIVLIGATMLPSQASDAGSDAGAPVTAPPTPPPTQAPPADISTPLPDLPAEGLSLGSSGPAVEALETRLAAMHYDPGPTDDFFDASTEFAVMAFEKVHGMEPTGTVDTLVWAALDAAVDPEPLLPEGGARRIEVDLERQLLFAYDGGDLTLITHISSGSEVPWCAKGECGDAVTPAGSHRFMWRVEGWRQAKLGRLYNPVYFTGGGIAVHGFGSVPTYPASHGCVRVPMHIAEYFPTMVEQGDPIYVFDGETKVQPISVEPPDEDVIGSPGDPVRDRSDERPEIPEPMLDGTPPPTTTTTAPSGDLW